LRINELGYQVQMTNEAKLFIADKGFDEKYGARPLNRAIQKYVEDPLAEPIINSEIEEGDTILISLSGEADDRKIDVNVEKAVIEDKSNEKEPKEENSKEDSKKDS
jgi:ATP-dependent Clp protease ATP-binding subunit ClpC